MGGFPEPIVALVASLSLGCEVRVGPGGLGGPHSAGAAGGVHLCRHLEHRTPGGSHLASEDPPKADHPTKN